ncbi:unnamed protein product [Haemonchus placei]|uniref:Arginine/serine-rich protein 1 n=1 Tax=Haemonchus placei TaxID=6290 RepID=A0A158QJX6_HAEPC|nr:unnamed protein product [Haemonchus placei]
MAKDQDKDSDRSRQRKRRRKQRRRDRSSRSRSKGSRSESERSGRSSRSKKSRSPSKSSRSERSTRSRRSRSPSKSDRSERSSRSSKSRRPPKSDRSERSSRSKRSRNLSKSDRSRKSRRKHSSRRRTSKNASRRQAQNEHRCSIECDKCPKQVRRRALMDAAARDRELRQDRSVLHMMNEHAMTETMMLQYMQRQKAYGAMRSLALHLEIDDLPPGTTIIREQEVRSVKLTRMGRDGKQTSSPEDVTVTRSYTINAPGMGSATGRRSWKKPSDAGDSKACLHHREKIEKSPCGLAQKPVDTNVKAGKAENLCPIFPCGGAPATPQKTTEVQQRKAAGKDAEAKQVETLPCKMSTVRESHFLDFSSLQLGQCMNSI